MSTPTWTAPSEMGTTSIYARGWVKSREVV